MEHDEIKFVLKDGLEELFNRKLKELQEESEFWEKDVSEQMAIVNREMFQELSHFADWEYKNAQVQLYKLTGRMD